MAWEKVAEWTNPAWYAFSGEYTKAVITFQTSPEQLTWVLTNPIGEWLGEQIQNAAWARGQTILFYSLHKNTDPTWTTDWQIDLWGYGSPLAVAAVIAGALVSIGLGYITFKIISQQQVIKLAEVTERTEAARIEFIEKYEPKYGPVVIDWLDGITKPPPEVTKANPSILDDLKKVLPGIGIGAGTIIVIGLALFLLMGRR